MKGYLNSYLADIKKMNDDAKVSFAKTTKDRITKVLQFALKNLGEKPFHLYGRLNYAAMDSTLVAAATAQEKGVEDFKVRYAKLVKDSEYIDWVTKDTSDEKILTSRIRKALLVLAA